MGIGGLREQLADQVGAIKDGTAKDNGITLKAEISAYPMPLIRSVIGRVNSGEFCGAEPRHLRLMGIDTTWPGGEFAGPAPGGNMRFVRKKPGLDLAMSLEYSPEPWNPIPEHPFFAGADFDELFAEIEACRD